MRRQVFRQPAFLERGARRGLCGARSSLTVQHSGGGVREHLLGLIDLSARQSLQAVDLIQRQVSEQAQEPPDIAVLGVPPELPVVVGAAQVGVQPDRAANRLAHLLAGRGREQRRGQPEGRLLIHPADQFHPIDDVAPLVRAAHLQQASMAALQLQEIYRLHQHVVEFQEGHRLFTFQPRLDTVERQHAVDREMYAVVAQELDVAVLRQPVVIVDHDRVGRAVAEGQEPRKRPLDARQIGVDLGVGQQRPLPILVRRIADLGGAAAHQHDGLVTRLLETTQHHDLDQTTHMQAGGRGVETDVGGDDPGARGGVQFRRMGDLVDVAARLHRLQECGREGGIGHRVGLCGRSRGL